MTPRFLIRKCLRPIAATLFHYAYYTDGESWQRNTFLGYPVLQNPLDLQIYQEVIFRIRPKFILQTGVAHGGSLLFFASILDLLGAPASAIVVGVDINLSSSALSLNHPRIRLVEGDSTAAGIIDGLRLILPAGGGLVSLDSDHHRDHVLLELKLYSQFVAEQSYLIAEDTNINGHPVNWAHGPGPREAVEIFLKQDTRFVSDDALWRRNLISHHAHGWLKRVSI